MTDEEKEAYAEEMIQKILSGKMDLDGLHEQERIT